jgi:hypothetical protein
MAIRAFNGVQTIAATGTAQPVFGTTLSAASTMRMDQHTLNTKPGSQDSVSLLTVTSAGGFRVGDRVAVGPKANFVVNGVLDTGYISAISGSVLTVQGLLNVHASGEYVLLNEPASIVNIFPVNVADQVYVGTDSTTSSTDGSVFAAGSPAYWVPFPTTTGTGNAYQTMQFWIAGMADDTFVASISQI